MSEAGICAIKKEFIISGHVKQINFECVSEKSKQTSQNNSNGNEDRSKPLKVAQESELCNTLIDIAKNEETQQCANEKCVFLHSTEEYLKNKPKDVGDYCYNFDRTGRCVQGITCRFGGIHISENGYNKIDEDKYNKHKNKKLSTVNHLNNDLSISLQENTYDFSKTETIISAYNENHKKTSGTVTDEDLIKIRKPEMKTIDWNGKLYLGPLTTLGNLPFRRICKEYGADITCGEMALCTSLLQGLATGWTLIKRYETEDIFGVQLGGCNAHTVAKTAQMLQENCQVDFVEINLASPRGALFEEGGGCALTKRPEVLGEIVHCTSEVLNVPVTLKMRTGMHTDQNIAHTLMPKLKEWGASMITLHGRSAEQRYSGLADWRYINKCAELAAPVALFGNGDIFSYDDYANIRENYKNVSGVTIGRGALIKPWIFTEIKEQRLWDISSQERFDILKKYANYGLEHWGSDTKGVENTRRCMLEWLSFLHRYVPVGILERPPQKINEQPQPFRGRDDLETLMASANCSDWIKISEMLLGPVPENFHFTPKHKANAYK